MTTARASENVVDLRELTVSLDAGENIVEAIDLSLREGEILGLVGESGSGKTTTGLALLGYANRGARISDGQLLLKGVASDMSDAMRPLRGSTVAYIPQDPGQALNPSMRVSDAVQDVLRAHSSSDQLAERAVAQLEAVGLSPTFLRRFPHQLSGGQQQRVCIGIALSCGPALLVLDEPTTGLDVVTQSLVLDALQRLRDELGVAMVYITHDLAVVAQIADTIAVMYAGRVVEQGPAEAILRRPRHPYTRGLLASSPDHLSPGLLEPMPGVAPSVGERRGGCSFAPRCALVSSKCVDELPSLVAVTGDIAVRCFHWQSTPDSIRAPVQTLAKPEKAGSVAALEVEDLRLEYRTKGNVSTVAADDVSFVVEEGACVGLVGESGSGKSTIARGLVGLHPVARGHIRLHGQELPSGVARRSLDQRRRIQLIGQNPSDSLNPRRSVRDQITRPLKVLRGMRRNELPREVGRLLDAVRLPARLGDRFPHELSGGERQRVAIARALAASPQLLVCDEITSALDVSVQATVLQLLQGLRRERALSLLFITHDLGVVAAIADDVLVLDHGRICERGTTTEVLTDPSNPYTRALLNAAPSITRALAARESSETTDTTTVLGP
jgi:peptide/nickel transport system ATP-binding protein